MRWAFGPFNLVAPPSTPEGIPTLSTKRNLSSKGSKNDEADTSHSTPFILLGFLEMTIFVFSSVSPARRNEDSFATCFSQLFR